MKSQAEADTIIAAYLVCGDTLNALERKHGYIINVYRRGEQYVWSFVDRSTVVLNADGSLAEENNT